MRRGGAELSNSRRRLTLAVGALTGALASGEIALSGCSPLTAPVPFHLAETAQVLKPGAASVTAFAGGGGLGLDGNGGGLGLRVRVGVGARQEAGFEGTAIHVDTGTHDSNSPSYVGTSWSFAGKLSWKAAPLGWLAVITGVGASQSVIGSAAGGDLAVVFSTARALGGWFIPYGGLRAGVAVPVGHGTDGGVTTELVVPVGFASVMGRARFFVEGGYLEAWAKGTKFQAHGGGYAGLGLAVHFGD
jgi:hypothetical protein